jgi:CRP/FNR family cyclic AMP-dependent transcriptional regulator
MSRPADRTVSVLDEVPDLAGGLSPAARAAARPHAVAPVIWLQSGPWRPRFRHRDDELGLLVLDGVLLHSIAIDKARAQLVGAGDVIRPWDYDQDGAVVPFRSRWEVVRSARIALLDAGFADRVSSWPQVITALSARATRRTRWLALQFAIADVRGIDERLMLFFWLLADRWGRVRPDGVLIPVPLTHGAIGQLVCAQRPTVTSALRRLIAAGRIQRRPDKTWVLSPLADSTRPAGDLGLALPAGQG